MVYVPSFFTGGVGGRGDLLLHSLHHGDEFSLVDFTIAILVTVLDHCFCFCCCCCWSSSDGERDENGKELVEGEAVRRSGRSIPAMAILVFVKTEIPSTISRMKWTNQTLTT